MATPESAGQSPAAETTAALFSVPTLRITYVIKGVHSLAWLRRRIAQMEQKGVDGPPRDEEGVLRSGFDPRAIRAAALASKARTMNLGLRTTPGAARALAKMARGLGATEVAIAYVVDRLDVGTGRWSRVGGGSLPIEGDSCPTLADYADPPSLPL
jgi:hypothetical protein